MSLPPTRRWIQGGLLVGFLLLFAHTAYRGADVLRWPVHLVFRLDPLALLAEWAAVGAAALHWGWLAAGLLVLSSLWLGRFFCGWMCPLGTVLDLFRRGLERLSLVRSAPARLPPWTAATVLTALVVATFLGLPLLGVFDPLSLLLRSLTLVFHPLLDAGAKGLVDTLSRAENATLAQLGDQLYRLTEPWLLAFGRPAFLGAVTTGLVCGAILWLESRAPRFWCTHLCPLGALLGLCARLGPGRRERPEACGSCRICADHCASGAAAAAGPADPGLCIQCQLCQTVCPRDARRPAWALRGPALPAPPGRRAFVGAAAGGAVLALVPALRAEEQERGWRFIRPPGAHPEEEFRKRCIRCGACMRVCPRTALHPALLEAGMGALWSPRLVPRLGYCEYHCRLCGQVCPTGAISYLEAGEKEHTAIGLAVFDRDRCLPYRKAQDCMVCEEHCPTAPKAIEFRETEMLDPTGRRRRVKLPFVVEDRCIGCGICENKCPLPGRSAILVAREIPGDLSIFF